MAGFSHQVDQLFEALKSHLDHAATQSDLVKMESKLMSQITDWAAKEQADLTTINASLAQIVTQIAALNAQIAAFNNSPGTLAAADQAALDGIKAASDALVTSAAAIVPAGTAVPAVTK
jgi:NAD-specific glutamate dehydrogenase